jgi:predicted dithiol-disulfide oxidoreductase (DUF899 family)
MCTSLMSSWEEKIPDIEQCVAFAMLARSRIERLIAAKHSRGWTKLQVYSDNDGDTCDYVSAEDADVPAYNVFTPKSGAIHHFWGGAMGSDMADPGQDQRGALGWEAACRTPFLFDSAAVRPLARHSHRLPRHEQKAPPSERCNRRLITQPTYREASGRTLS